MAREEKNKRVTAGGGSSNQSTEAYKKSDNRQKSNRNKRKTGGSPSEQHRSLASEFDKGARSRPEEQTRSINTHERRFNLVVDSVPYMISAQPFQFNEEVRYRVSVNGGPEHVFTWDSSLGQLRAIDDEASTLPDNVEEAISEKLQSKA